ncbi:NAD-dependent epimerase/dehydratase family protein [Roseibium sp. Sym1]|uniref:NAD-dependent epimerase/dehydratase family protein n=1 Tax=Roseibium sp. Sym1 TaxID=3016006 RepID=UPI0022B50295|nr:NAD(P)-dependent oxidoreductase [Roseibium sp. Sym1]
MRLLVTGSTGKVGQNFLPAFLASDTFRTWSVVALCNNRVIDENDRVRVVKGSINDPETVRDALTGVTHVLHMAAVKESPDLAIDVSVKGMFLLLEHFRQLEGAKQFILVGGDCSVGHMFQPYQGPVTEQSARKAYPGCYALTKVLEEVMLEQYQHQYDLNGCVLRAPWIMEKDDFKYALSFGPDQFGGPPWPELVSGEALRTYAGADHVPLLLDRDGKPLRRNFVHVSDLVSAILAALDNPAARQQLFNISMNEPVDYGKAARHLAETRSYRIAEIPTDFHSNWLVNAKARQTLDWEPSTDLEALVEGAWNYRRDAKDPRKIWYPG